MNRFLLYMSCFLLFSLIRVPILAQQKLKIVLSEKHQEKIEKIEDPREKLRLYKKYYTKDSIKYIRSLDKKLKQQSDSIYASMRKLEQKKLAIVEKVNNDKIVQQAGKVGVHPPVPPQGGSRASLGIGEAKNPEDKLSGLSSQLSNDKLLSVEKLEKPIEDLKGQTLGKAHGKVGELQKEVTPYQQYYNQYKDYLNNPDSMKVMIRKVAEKELEALPEKLAEKAGSLGEGGTMQLTQQKALADKIKGMPDQYNTQMEKLGDSEQMMEKGKSLAKEKAIEYLRANQDVIAAAQKKMTKLKKIYSKVTNSNDLSTAVKRNSLKGKPLIDRLFIGGNFQVINLDPFSIDMSPSIGYRWNKKLISGLGIIYRHTFGQYDSTHTAIPEQNYGANAFVQYDAYKGFFAFATYERTSRQLFDEGSDRPAESFVPGLMLGLGKNAAIHPKLNTQFLVLYNLLHEQGISPYKSPWVIKAGFSLR